jgi:hypothetical protein
MRSQGISEHDRAATCRSCTPFSVRQLAVMTGSTGSDKQRLRVAVIGLGRLVLRLQRRGDLEPHGCAPMLLDYLMSVTGC